MSSAPLTILLGLTLFLATSMRQPTKADGDDTPSYGDCSTFLHVFGGYIGEYGPWLPGPGDPDPFIECVPVGCYEGCGLQTVHSLPDGQYVSCECLTMGPTPLCCDLAVDLSGEVKSAPIGECSDLCSTSGKCKRVIVYSGTGEIIYAPMCQ